DPIFPAVLFTHCFRICSWHDNALPADLSPGCYHDIFSHPVHDARISRVYPVLYRDRLLFREDLP
ncbi:MAG TPA: hypothetical protein PK272_02660, partial [Methanoregulaceae archaeon]|nr:hypothetical protein [Methanoregulaceae archaeon]